MGELITLGEIQDRIFKIRGQSVMLDRDLAALYGMRTIALRQQVRRNIDHFPEDFAFQLTREHHGGWRGEPLRGGHAE